MADHTVIEFTTTQPITEHEYTDNEFVEILDSKVLNLKKEYVIAKKKADTLLKDAKDAQTEVDKLKNRLKIVKHSSEKFTNTLDKKSIDVPKEKEVLSKVEGEILSKVLVVGDIGTGKTSIIKRGVHDIFSIHYKSTIGVDFALKKITSNDIIHRLQLWDLGGQERFGNMTRVYYKEAMAAFVVFDVTRMATLDAVKKWKDDIDAKVTLPNSEIPIPVILLANKVDLIQEDECWGKTDIEMDEFCKECGFVAWYKISAKNDNGNINLAMDEISSKIIEYYNKHNIKLNYNDNSKDGELTTCSK